MKANVRLMIIPLLLVVLAAIDTRFNPAGLAQAETATAPPTNTPRHTADVSPTPVVTPTALPPFRARLCADCSRIRLRATPGTAGEVVDFLDSTTQFVVLGRSDDAQWLKITVDGSAKTGWIAAQYARLSGGQEIGSSIVAGLPVLDTAIAASPTPTSSVGLPYWLSGVTSHSKAIFLKGQALGNRANVFSKVGDSISASAYFLTPIGQGSYELGPYGSLANVISYFSEAKARVGNSFSNTSLAAGGSWSSNTLLLPGLSSPELCGKDTPLVCEYKLVKPAIALIMVGTNDSGSGSTDQFQGNLRQIVQTSMDMGVIPVLSTIPPKPANKEQTARGMAFNQVIRATAQQFDIPLWDYAAVLDKAPNQGISADGMHPSVPPDGLSTVFDDAHLQYGYTIRNLTALQTLDILWRLVLAG